MSTETPHNAEKVTLDLDHLRAVAEAATPGPWHWAGNTDTGEPYLASWAPGMGRTSVMAIGYENRKTTGREADRVRSDAEEYDLGDPDEVVEDWATDRYGEPIKEPRLWFYRDHMAVYAREHVQFEVAPGATTREDPKVYRADITDVRLPDAQHIATFSPATVLALLYRLAAVEALADGLEDHAFTKYCAEDSCRDCLTAEAIRAAVHDRLNPPALRTPEEADQ